MMTTIKKIQKLGVFILALFFCGSMVMAQTTIGHIGGKESNAVYNFLNLPHSAKASSLVINILEESGLVSGLAPVDL